MATSRIEITFTSDLQISDNLYFEKRFYDGTLNSGWQPVTETWVNLRSNPNQVTLGTPTATAGERSAINFMQSIGLDYTFTYAQNGELIDGVTRVGNKVIIKVERFWNFRLADPDLNPEGVSIEIFNWNNPLFFVDDLEFQEATVNPPCTHYKVVVTANEVIDNYSVNGGSLVDSNNEIITFEVLRGQALTFTIYSEDDQQNTLNLATFQVPQNINLGIYNLQIVNSPNGATVSIIMLQSIINPLDYSLDNSTWQTSNVFTGLPSGDYTLYVRDAYGCSFSETFTITEFGGARIPYFRMPKGNSIRFANRISWSDCSNYKTDDNSLSCEADVPLPYKEIQQFQSCDIDTTQFRSNYSENLATIIKENGDEISLPVVKVSNYMGLKDRRDCRKFDLGNGKTGVYFISGNIYDYDTGIDTGDDYVLNGLLPDWAIIGTYFKLDTEWFLIEDTYFDEDVNSDVIVVSNNYSGADVLAQASSVYNLENFEEYEFVIDMVDYLNQNIQVRVNANDDGFENIEHLSELINVKIRQSNTKEIRYSNSTNTDINYSRGIEHKLRIPIEKVSGKSSDESESYKTDSSALLLKAVIHDLDVFEFQPVTKQMMRKLVLALSHDTVRIDGVSYVKSDAIEVEGPLEETNLYVVTATMIKSNSVFNSNSGEGDNSFAGEAIEIPGLVDYNGGYVRY